MATIPDDKAALAMLKDRIAALEADLAKEQAENARMREVLQFYADGWQFVVEHDMHGYDRSRWHRSPAIDKDCGWTARDALGD